MDRNVFFTAFALLLLSVGFAATSTDALNFVGKQNYFMEEGETYELNPNTLLSYAEKDYWVVSVFSGDVVTFLVPVENSKELALAKGSITRRKLVETTYSLQLLDKISNTFANQGKWPFTQSNSSFFTSLSLYFQDKKGKIEIVRSDLTAYPEIQAMFPSISSEIDSLSAASLELSTVYSEIVAENAGVLESPDVNNVKSLFDSYATGLDKTFLLYSSFTRLSSGINTITNAIARTDLDSATKLNMNRTISVSDNFAFVSSLNQSALQLDSSLNQIKSKASKDTDTFLDVLSSREKKNEIAHFLFLPKQEIYDKTDGQFDELDMLVASVLDESTSAYWKDQESLAELEDNWRKATRLYSEAKYELAMNYGNKALKNALAVYSAGFHDFEDNSINEELLVIGMAFLIILLIIIYAVKNRDRIFSVTKGGEEEDVEIDAFSKI